MARHATRAETTEEEGRSIDRPTSGHAMQCTHTHSCVFVYVCSLPSVISIQASQRRGLARRDEARRGQWWLDGTSVEVVSVLCEHVGAYVCVSVLRVDRQTDRQTSPMTSDWMADWLWGLCDWGRTYIRQYLSVSLSA